MTSQKDVVVHHQTKRGPNAPSLSPFCLKLETFLKMAKVPFVNVHDSLKNRSSKGKMTWVEYNGEEIADSEFCIDFIKDKFSVDLNSNYTAEELAAGFMVQKMVEEHLYWAFLLYRYVYEKSFWDAFPRYSFIIRYIAKRHILRDTWSHGIGRHSESEVYTIMIKDLENLSLFLGTKKFMLGETPSQVDCSVFGMLAQFHWQAFGGKPEDAMKKYPNLCEYCERMKAEFWPDWDQCISRGKPSKADK